MLSHSYITSCSTLPIVKDPPSTNIRPGPVACSIKGELVSKPPFLELLYSHPVVDDSFLEEHDARIIILLSAKINLFVFIIFY